MLFNYILAIALATGSTQAFFRLPCSQTLVTERVDSIVAPGKVASHSHMIFGGSDFSPISTFAGSRSSVCSSCAAKADMSNYWTPSLFFHHANDSFTSVPISDFGVYYLNRTHKTDKNPVIPFPDGLKMLAGNAALRYFNSSNTMAKNIKWNCTGLPGTDPKTAESEFKTPYLPLKQCPSGIRGIITFPSCWDGKNTDSSTHQTHMSYPVGGVENGPCPVGYPVRLITLRFETTFKSNAYNESWSDAMNTTQPFVLSSGDGTGYGYHGDFFNGWDSSVLQQVIDTCHDANMSRISSCPVLDVYNKTIDGTCRKTPDVNEIVTGTLTVLPGCNPVAYAPVTTPASCPNLITPPFFNPTTVYRGLIPPPGSNVLSDSAQVVTSYGNYTYIDCFSYDAGTKPLSNMLKLNATSMTIEQCLDSARMNKFTYAALANSNQCWSGNSINSTTTDVIGYGQCAQVCTGNDLQICGGRGRIFDLYKTNETFPVVLAAVKPAPAVAPAPKMVVVAKPVVAASKPPPPPPVIVAVKAPAPVAVAKAPAPPTKPKF